MGIPRPPKVDKILSDLSKERREDYSLLLGYICKLEGDIQDYRVIDYKQNRLDLIAVNNTIKEKNILIEELTNLLEPKED